MQYAPSENLFFTAIAIQILLFIKDLITNFKNAVEIYHYKVGEL